MEIEHTVEQIQQAEGNCYVLLHGMPHLDEAYVIAPGMSLLPLENPLDVFDLAALGAVGFREWAVLEPFIRGCTVEIESPLDSAIQPGYDTLNRAWLATTMLVLRGFSTASGVSTSNQRWGSVPHSLHADSWTRKINPTKRRTRTDLPQFHGGILDLHMRVLDVSDEAKQSMTEDDAKWLHGHYGAMNQMCSDSERFRLALSAAVDCRYATDERSAIARQWSGIEAILGISSELVYRISLTAASLLEDRGPERLARSRAIKKLYHLRSKAVHGDSLSAEQLRTGLFKSYALLRELLLLQINRGSVFTKQDFDEAIYS